MILQQPLSGAKRERKAVAKLIFSKLRRFDRSLSEEGSKLLITHKFRADSQNRHMTHFSFITGGIFVFLATGSLIHAQATRPVFPAQRPAPPPVSAPQVGQPRVPPGATVAPAAGGTQPTLPVSRPADSLMGPAVPPSVTYRDGLLTIQAINSNLSSVITAIRNKTGIEFEGAENISERVAISLGPAPEGDVLGAIFSGSSYDYVALGRPDSPSIVQRVILTVKNKSGTPVEAQAQPRPAQGEGDEEEVPEEQVNAGGEPQDTPVQPPQIPQQPPQVENQQPKTPEQILQELQQLQQQNNNKKSPTDDQNQNPSQAPRKTLPPR
jgi:hypothetical protein